MRDDEAKRLSQILLGLESVSPMLNLGSSTARFREIEKPHIDATLFASLRKAGIEVVHCDRKAAAGVDLAIDILDPAAPGLLKPRGFRSVLLSNLLEHVEDRRRVADRCEEIVGPGGFILVSVPSSYPYHADPIDTGYRPSPRDLAALFKRSHCLAAEELSGPTWRQDLEARGSTVLREAMRTIGWMFVSFARPRSARARVHRWFWFSRPYRVAIALLQVRDSAA